MMYGLDFLGIAKYPDVALREFPEGWALGAFAVEFGDAYSAVEAIVRSGRCPHVRIQLTWSRENHTYTDKHFEIAKRQAVRYERMAVLNPSVKFELSTFCEHKLRDPDRYHDKIAALAPHCQIVNSVWKGALSKKYKNEVHGLAGAVKGPCNYSFDGTGCVDADVKTIKETHKNCEVFFFWTYQFNGNRNGSTTDDKGKPLPYIEPTNRLFWPTSPLIDSVIYQKNEKGKTKLPKGYTLKSHADQQVPKPPPGSRELKPLILSPKKINRYELVAANGQVIAVTGAPSPYRDGRYRYYFADFGYQLAEKAIRIQGSPVVKVREGGKVIGTVNPAFRENEYRKK